MDPITPALTPPLDGHFRSTYLPRNRSLVSVKSLIALSFCTTSETAANENSRDDTHKVSSTEQQKYIRCPHCMETVNVTQCLELNSSGNHEHHDLQAGDSAAESTPVGRDSISSVQLETETISPPDSSGSSGVDVVTQQVRRTIQETDQALQRLCQEIHQIHLLNPTPLSSRPGSLRSVALSEHQGPRDPPTPPADEDHAITSDDKFIPEVTVSAVDHESENTGSTRRYPILGNQLGFGIGSPFINDLGDLENFAFANARLLRTLQDRVNKVELAEKTLRLEREELQREKAEVKQLKEQVEKEKMRLMDKGLRWEDYRIDGGCGLPLVQETGRSSPIGASPSPRGSKVAVVDNEWSYEKEQKLQELEAKLKKANRAWSDEQEEIVEVLERLREEKRLDEKAKKINRQISVRVERKWSHEERPEKDKTSKKNRKDSNGSNPRPSLRNSLTILGRKSSTGSMTRRDSSPSSASTPKEKKIFKKWF
ncbi:hypothetical protein RUND412_004233 [Rhizina undulata]